MSSTVRLAWVLFLGCAAFAEEGWPEWRGVSGQGVSKAKELPAEWSETKGIKWKAVLRGRGWSTPVVEGDQIWVTTAIENAASAEQAEKRLKENTGDQPVTVLESVSLRAICVSLESGEILQDVELLNVKEPQWVHQLNSYASPSPIVKEGRLYAHFGSFGSACLDTRSGSVLWRNEELHVQHENGPGSTPVLWKDRLMVHFDGSDVQFIVALSTETGKVLWRSERSGEMDPRPQQKKAYGTPLLVETASGPVVVSGAADWVYGYAPDSGKELWKVPYGELGFSMSVRPVADAERIYISTSFGKSQVIALKYSGLTEPEVLWRNNKNAPKMCSPVLAGGLLYYVDDGGILSCVDALTGEAVYRERLSGKFSASLLLADGRLWVCSREGVTFVVAPGREFKLLAQNSLEGQIMASPIALDGALFIRTDKALYRLGK
jgi:outer membrane protein assembly factor BamB